MAQYDLEPFQNVEVIDSQLSYTLKTVLTETGIDFTLITVDLQQVHGNCYALSMKDAEMPTTLNILFGNLEKVFYSCFAKKENYEIREGGRIIIKYIIALAVDSMNREFEIKL